MRDERNGQTIIGFKLDETWDADNYCCQLEADNWVIQWAATEPPGSVWATMDDRRDDPRAAFRVWPLHYDVDEIPEGTTCDACGSRWECGGWVVASR